MEAKMNPDEVLKDIRRLAAEILSLLARLETGTPDVASLEAVAHLAADLARSNQELDRWMIQGGALPLDWRS
jgi:hypothetical protein